MTASRQRASLTAAVALLPVLVLLFVPPARLGLPRAPERPMIDFVLDDAYITFRYAANLAAGHGPTWNPGEAPVEGYTSFLWMLVAAASDAAGIRPPATAKAVSLACVAALVWLVTRRARGGRATSLIPAIGVALCPAFLLAATQGMETGLAALLAAIAVDRYLALHRGAGGASLPLFHAAGTLGALTRPELAVLWAGLTAALAFEHRRSRRTADLTRLLAWGLGIVVLPGVAYLAWRAGFYGDLLPNTFFAKRPAGAIDRQGALRLVRFLIEIAAPYLVLLLAALAAAGGESGDADGARRRRAILGALLAIAAFLAVGLRFRPLQGMLYRFQMPVYPALLLLLAATVPRGVFHRGADRIAAAARTGLVLLVALHSLATFPEALRGMALRWPHDRAEMGRRLAGVGGGGPTMLVSESGALPYYSGWRAFDTHGLNDRRIARRGLSAEDLARIDPDLVVVLVKPAKRLAAYGPLLDLLAGGDYRLAAAVAKSDPDLRLVNDHQHLYFVKRASPWALPIGRAILSAPVLRVPPAFPGDLPPAAR